MNAPWLASQPSSVVDQDPVELDGLIVSGRRVGQHWIVLSRYGDDRWRFDGQPTNRQLRERFIDFAEVPTAFRAQMKAIVYRYLCRGREGRKRPSHRSVIKLPGDARPFLRHLDALGITRFSAVTPLACAQYVEACKRRRLPPEAARADALMKSSSLAHRFGVVEALYELSQHTDDPMPSHPWPGTSSTLLAGLAGPGTGKRNGGTALIPDDVFATLFQRAWAIVEQGDRLLELREGCEQAAPGPWTKKGCAAQHRFLENNGWLDGTVAFSTALLELRTACYVVLASLTGCRNHELAFLQSSACYSTPVDASNGGDGPGEVYWWIRSQSTNTGEGHTEWMVPPAAVTALRMLERWAAPYQAAIAAEIAERKAADPFDPEIAEAQRHLHAVFLAAAPMKGNRPRTLSAQMCNLALRAFAKRCGLDWKLASHQFRRKFANYAARSQFGDLRYLREHFKHWSMDMTLGYALNESQEIALYGEIEQELGGLKTEVVASWLDAGEPLAGGYGRRLVAWRATAPVTLFKNHAQMVRCLADSTAIRSNGHAWCTADDTGCVGNDMEPTRCVQCNHAVIGRVHEPLYRGLRDHLLEVADRDDIGRGGKAMVQRDLRRCESVLAALAPDVEGS